MNKYERINNLLYYFVIIFIFLNIVLKHKDNLKFCMIYILIFFLLVIIDYMRNNYFYKEKTKYFNSLIISTVLCAILAFYARGYTFIYFYLIIYPIIMLREIKKRKILLVFNFLVYIVSNILSGCNIADILEITFWKDYGVEILSVILCYFSFAFMNSYYRYQIEEKIKLKKLSLEFAEANEKLKEYSKKVEELTIENERNRVAQEIHDSLGHSLTALIMQLDYVEKIMEINPQKAKEIIVKAQNSARNSMTEVRQAVYCLKNKDISKGLIEIINEMILNIKLADNIIVDFDADGEFETLKPEIKNIIYKTIQEGLTNGIKHGKADEFSILLVNKNNEIMLNIKDNGQGCADIIKGNGLTGIESRICAVGGEVDFKTGVKNGFYIEVSIPIEYIETETAVM